MYLVWVSGKIVTKTTEVAIVSDVLTKDLLFNVVL
jgi:hypothetical protein